MANNQGVKPKQQIGYANFEDDENEGESENVHSLPAATRGLMKQPTRIGGLMR